MARNLSVNPAGKQFETQDAIAVAKADGDRSVVDRLVKEEIRLGKTFVRHSNIIVAYDRWSEEIPEGANQADLYFFALMTRHLIKKYDHGLGTAREINRRISSAGGRITVYWAQSTDIDGIIAALPV